MNFPPEALQRLHRIFFAESPPPTEWFERLSALQQEHEIDGVDLIAYFHAVYVHNNRSSSGSSVVTDAVRTPLSQLKHFGSKVTVLIQTTNSERWLGHVLTFYETIGVKIVFALDGQTSDGARTLLSSKGAACVEIGDEQQVDCLTDHIFATMGTDWILRVGDAELPTPALLNFIDSAVEHSTTCLWGFPRVHCRYDACRSELQYSRFLPFGPFAPADLQWRLVARSAGPKERRSATTDAVLLNFDWIARSFIDRVDRLRFSGGRESQASTSLAPFYLHETIPQSWHMFSPLKDERYTDFAARVHQSTAAGRRPVFQAASP